MRKAALAIAGVALPMLVAQSADAHWVADDAVLLEPYDPTPQIQFRHYDRDYWLDRHCSWECQAYYFGGPGYGRPWHHDHDWGAPPSELAGYDARAARSDAQSDEWNHAMDHWHDAMDWYDHAVIGPLGHDHDHDHDHDDHDHHDHDGPH